MRQGAEVGRGDRRFERKGALQLPACGQQSRHLLTFEVVDVTAEKKSVEQSAEGVVLGKVVGSGEERQERELVDLGAAAVDPLVEHRQQVVEDRAIGVEELVEEDEFAFGQHACRDRRHGPFPEPRQVDGTEDLVRLGEAGKQIFKVTSPYGHGELADQGGFGGSGRSVQEQVLAGGYCQRDHVDDFIAADEPPFQRLDDFASEAGHRIFHYEFLIAEAVTAGAAALVRACSCRTS